MSTTASATGKNKQLASWIFGTGLLVYLMVVAFVMPDPTAGQIPIIRFLMALLAGFFTLFFVGDVSLNGTLFNQRFAAGGGVAVFLLVQVFVDPFTVRSIAGDQLSKAVRPDKRIASVQEGLHRLGLLPKSPDGVRDSATTDAIKRFQREHSLVPNGAVTEETLNALEPERKPIELEGFKPLLSPEPAGTFRPSSSFEVVQALSDPANTGSQPTQGPAAASARLGHSQTNSTEQKIRLFFISPNKPAFLLPVNEGDSGTPFDAKEAATRIVSLLVLHGYFEVYSQFDPHLERIVWFDRLVGEWKGLERRFGRCWRGANPALVPGTSNIVNIVAIFDRAQIPLRIGFNNRLQVASIYFFPPVEQLPPATTNRVDEALDPRQAAVQAGWLMMENAFNEIYVRHAPVARTSTSPAAIAAKWREAVGTLGSRNGMGSCVDIREAKEKLGIDVAADQAILPPGFTTFLASCVYSKGIVDVKVTFNKNQEIERIVFLRAPSLFDRPPASAFKRE